MNNEQELKHEIMELESQLAHKKEKYNRLKFINSNNRYFLCETGDIYGLTSTVDSGHMEKAVKQNNTFKTVKDAEKERDRRALLYEFNQFRDECNNGWKPDWKDSNELKFYIAFGKKGYLEHRYACTLQLFVTFGYFHDCGDCIEAIEKFGDRIKKLYVE